MDVGLEGSPGYLTWRYPPSLSRWNLLCPLDVLPEAEAKHVFKKDSQFLGQD